MEPKRRRILICVVLLLSIGNYSRIQGTEHIRAIEFVSIFAMGAMAGLLLREIATALKNKWLV
jgi:hypothetical protein